MELKPGYKLTEVGVIPEDWDIVTVQKLVEENILEKPLDGNHGSIHPNSSDYVDHGIPFVMANNFANGQIDLLGCKFISKERADKLQKGFSISGDVLLTHKGTVGSTAIVGELSTEYIMLTPQVTYYRVANTNCLDNRFLRHYFDSSSFQSLFVNLAGGGTRAYLGIVKQLALPVIQPPIEEQRSIATALSDTDALLEALERLIAKKRDLKQATMQRLLTGKTRLPGFSGKWEVKRLELAADCLDNVRVPLNEAQRAAMKGDYPYCGANGVLDYVNGYVIDDDIILMAEDGGYFDEYETRPIAYRMKGKCWVNNHAHILKAKAGCDQGFLFYSLVHKNVLPFLASGTRAKLNKFELNKIEARFPAQEAEQRAIATVLADMDAEIAALEQRRDKTRALKQGMMQELLTGRTRLV